MTDAVMATIWAAAPGAVAYAISAGAEAGHLGADLAIVHSATNRVLLYQAKLALLDASGNTLRLKSELTPAQHRLLGQESVVVDGDRYMVTGRLATYQTDHTCCMDGCNDVWPIFWWHDYLVGPGHPAGGWHGHSSGRTYCEDVLRRHACSPGGVLAAGPTFRRSHGKGAPDARPSFDAYRQSRQRHSRI